MTERRGKRYKNEEIDALRSAVRRLCLSEWKAHTGRPWPDPDVEQMMRGERAKAEIAARDGVVLKAWQALADAEHPAAEKLTDDVVSAGLRQHARWLAGDVRSTRTTVLSLARDGWLPTDEDPHVLALLTVLLELEWSPRWERNRRMAHLRGKGITVREVIEDIAHAFRQQLPRT